SRRRHTRSKRDWSSDVCSSDLRLLPQHRLERLAADEVEHRKAQEDLLLLPRELRPEEFPQQRVHVPGLGQRPAVFQEMIEIQRQMGRASWRERGVICEGGAVGT